jgi:AAA+ superfamily predicted ATPase
MSPCLLVFEDLDSLITEDSRSYFLSEVDGLESNDGIMMIGSTNYLEKLDAGITKRPSRFDRKYHFDLPAAPERAKYCEQWRSRLADKGVDFPERMCPAIAGITDGFSFTYLQEAFISSLLVVANQQNDAGRAAEERAQDGDSSSLESVLFWRVINQQVNMLRNEIKGSRKSAEDAIAYNGPKPASRAGFA